MANGSRLWVDKLTPAQRIEQVFVISQPQLRTTSRGDFYIAAYLSDSTGKINGRMWQASEEIFRSLPDEGFVSVKGRTESYQNNLQIVIDTIGPVDPKQVSLEDFLPRTGKDIDQMFARLTEILQVIRDPHLARLAQAFLKDGDLMALFKKAPAAAGLHHAYLGGLLEHTLSLMELGDSVLPLYPDLNADLVLMGLFLHDIGKTVELDCDISFKYSDQGRLLGHIVQGMFFVEEKIRELNHADPFPSDLKDVLLHIIAAHHGLREFGSPVQPATPEAFVVHHLDNLDSKIALSLAAIKSDPGRTHWTNYIKAIESALYKRRPHDVP